MLTIIFLSFSVRLIICGFNVYSSRFYLVMRSVIVNNLFLRLLIYVKRSVFFITGSLPFLCSSFLYIIFLSFGDSFPRHFGRLIFKILMLSRPGFWKFLRIGKIYYFFDMLVWVFNTGAFLLNHDTPVFFCFLIGVSIQYNMDDQEENWKTANYAIWYLGCLRKTSHKR